MGARERHHARDRPRPNSRRAAASLAEAVVGLILALAGAGLWSCALTCSVAGVDGHMLATCSLGAALSGAAFGVQALEAIALDPERWGGRGLARAAIGISAAAVGLNVATFAGPFPA